MARARYTHNQIVGIKKYKGDRANQNGRVVSVGTNDGVHRYWVTNMNMPFMGCVSDFFLEHELEEAYK